MPKTSSTKVTDDLQGILVDLISLSLQSKQAYWNVTGPFFAPLHEQFDAMAAQYRDWSDEVAERMRALLVPAGGRLSVVAATSRVEELPAGEIVDRTAVTLLLERIEGLVTRIRARLAAMGEADAVTQDLVIGIVQGLEKQAWMLRSQQS